VQGRKHAIMGDESIPTILVFVSRDLTSPHSRWLRNDEYARRQPPPKGTTARSFTLALPVIRSKIGTSNASALLASAERCDAELNQLQSTGDRDNDHRMLGRFSLFGCAASKPATPQTANKGTRRNVTLCVSRPAVHSAINPRGAEPGRGG